MSPKKRRRGSGEGAKEFYVYELARPDGRPFYVGKGKRGRLFRHEAEARTDCDCRKCRTIRKVWQDGGEVQRQVVFETDDEQEALDRERALIAQYGRENLCNHTDGGEGTSNPSEELREQMRQRQRANFQSPAFVARYRAGIARREAVPELKVKRRQATRAAMENTSLRVVLRERANKQWASPDARARKSQEVKARFANPTERLQLSKIMARWNGRRRRSVQLQAGQQELPLFKDTDGTEEAT